MLIAAKPNPSSVDDEEEEDEDERRGSAIHEWNRLKKTAVKRRQLQDELNIVTTLS